MRIIFAAANDLDIRQTLLLNATAQSLLRAGVNVNGQDATVRPNRAGQPRRQESVTRTNVRHHSARTNPHRLENVGDSLVSFSCSLLFSYRCPIDGSLRMR